VQAVTINNGMRMRAWYDIKDFDLANRADAEGVEASIAQVGALLDHEHARGIPASRTFLAGFSQGGAIALAAGVRRATPLAGVIALSTYLPLGARSFDTLGPGATKQPVFMAHGSADPVVPFAAGERSAALLREHDVAVDWHAYPMAHQVCAEEIADLGAWMAARFKAGSVGTPA
jgi:phospholipase/carboxylesterase